MNAIKLATDIGASCAYDYVQLHGLWTEGGATPSLEDREILFSVLGVKALCEISADVFAAFTDSYAAHAEGWA